MVGTEIRNETQERSLYVTLLVYHTNMLATQFTEKTYKCFSSELRELSVENFQHRILFMGKASLSLNRVARHMTHVLCSLYEFQCVL